MTGYAPTAQQFRGHTATERYVLFGGGMGSGKSVFLSVESIRLCSTFPNNRGFICRNDSEVFEKTTLQTLLDMLKTFPADMKVLHNKQGQFFEFSNNSRLHYGGLDRIRPNEIRRWGLGFFAIDEASEIMRSSFLLLRTRLQRKTVPVAAYKGLLTSNPERGWIKEDFIDWPIPNSVFIQALQTDNPYLPDDYAETLRSCFGSTKGWVERYLEGDWNAPTK